MEGGFCMFVNGEACDFVTPYIAATDSIFGCNRYKGIEGGFRACSDGEACLMQV